MEKCEDISRDFFIHIDKTGQYRVKKAELKKFIYPGLNHHDKRKNAFGRHFHGNDLISIEESAEFIKEKWKPKFINEVYVKVKERNPKRKVYLLMIGSPNTGGDD